jgi:uncharacterized membrane protein
MLYLAILLLGITAGLRAGTPLAVLSWAAYFGWIDLSQTWAAFAGHIATALVLSLLAILEYVGDQSPKAPSRRGPPQFGIRIVSGALVGLIAAWPSGLWLAGLVIGAVGAVIGTLGGFEARRSLARALGRDRPAGLIEDVAALVVAFGAAYFGHFNF